MQQGAGLKIIASQKNFLIQMKKKKTLPSFLTIAETAFNLNR